MYCGCSLLPAALLKIMFEFIIHVACTLKIMLYTILNLQSSLCSAACIENETFSFIVQEQDSRKFYVPVMKLCGMLDPIFYSIAFTYVIIRAYNIS